MQGIGRDRPASFFAVPRREEVFDAGEIELGVGQYLIIDGVTLLLCKHEGMCGLHRVVGDGLATPAPIREPAIVVLHARQPVNIVVDD